MGILAVPALLAACPVAAEEPPTDTAPRQTVVAGKDYAASGLYRLLFGADYRDIWTTPVSLPILDVERFGGGLQPVRIVGHGQSKALALKGADGHSYTFRPVLKDASGLLPVELRESKARDFVQDQMASGHPAGHVMVPPLLDAVGILHNVPRLVIMPNTPALGDFQRDFGGAVGDIEEFTGTPGFGGTLETIDGEEMWKRLRESPAVRPDARAYLKARLVDQVMGDWDRHRTNGAGPVADQPRWQPIPEDRDMAFVRFEGFVIGILRPTLPLLVKFGRDYSSLLGLTFDGWDVDKRILAELEKPAWDEAAREVKAALTDPVLERAATRCRRNTSRRTVPAAGRPEEPARPADRARRPFLPLHQRDGGRVRHGPGGAGHGAARFERRSRADRGRRPRGGAVLPAPLPEGRDG